jgi:hypothetical protein
MNNIFLFFLIIVCAIKNSFSMEEKIIGDPILSKSYFHIRAGDTWRFQPSFNLTEDKKIRSEFLKSLTRSSRELMDKMTGNNSTIITVESVCKPLGLEGKVILEKIDGILIENFFPDFHLSTGRSLFGGAKISLALMEDERTIFCEDEILDPRDFLQQVKMPICFDYDKEEDHQKTPHILIKSIILSFFLDAISIFLKDFDQKGYVQSSQFCVKHSFVFAEQKTKEEKKVDVKKEGYTVDCMMSDDMSLSEIESAFYKELCLFYGYQNNFLITLNRLTNHFLLQKSENDSFLAFHTEFSVENPLLKGLVESIQSKNFDFFKDKKFSPEDCVQSLTILSVWSGFYRCLSEILSGFNIYTKPYRWLENAMCFREMKEVLSGPLPKKALSKKEQEEYLKKALLEIEGDESSDDGKTTKQLPKSKKKAPQTTAKEPVHQSADGKNKKGDRAQTTAKKPKPTDVRGPVHQSVDEKNKKGDRAQTTSKKPKRTDVKRPVHQKNDGQDQKEKLNNSFDEQGVPEIKSTEISENLSNRSDSVQHAIVEDFLDTFADEEIPHHNDSVPPLPIDGLDEDHADNDACIDIEDLIPLVVKPGDQCPPTVEVWADLLLKLRSSIKKIDDLSLSPMNQKALLDELFECEKIRSMNLTDTAKWQILIERLLQKHKIFEGFVPDTVLREVYNYELIR